MKVLFTPIGSSDPVKCRCDGPMLHCLRVYKPDVVYMYFTKQMLEYEKKDNRYTWMVKKLGEKLGHKFEIRMIERPELIEVQRFDNFYDEFENIFDEIFREHPMAEFYTNASSGTPAIKSAVMICSVMSKRDIKVLQISSGKKTPVYDRDKDDTYDKEFQWENNQDNRDDFSDRSSIVEGDKFLVNIRKKDIAKYISAFDYQAALAAADEIKKYLTDDTLALLYAADARLKLDYRGVVHALSGMKYEKIPVNDDKNGMLTEYILWLGILIEKKDYSGFIRGISPAAMILMETAVEKYTLAGDIKRYCEKYNDRYILTAENMIKDDTGRKTFNMLNNMSEGKGFKDCEYTVILLEKIIQNMCEDEKIRLYTEIICKTSKQLCNQLLHEISIVSDELIKHKIGMTAADLYDTIKKMAERVGIVQKNNVWNSYIEMNKLIMDKLYDYDFPKKLIWYNKI